MNWKTTWLLLFLAALLFAFIYVIERHTQGTATAEPPPRLLSFRTEEITAIQLRQTNKLFLRAERTNAHWNITFPVFYPAQNFAVERFLQALAEVVGRAHIPMEEVTARQQTIADFGLDVPVAAVSLEQTGGRRRDIFFGNKTPVGDQVYLQLLSQPGIFVVPADLVDRLPANANSWRDPALMDLGSLSLDRMEVRLPAGGFEIRTDTTNNLFYLSKPTLARADTPRVQTMLQTIQSAKVTAFVTDDPRAELDRYGLQQPEAELVFGHGSNDLIAIEFGSSPTNAPDSVYARRLAQTNIVIVPRRILETLRVPPAQLRDRRVLAFKPETVQSIEIAGSENFVMERQPSGGWMVSGPPIFQGDAELIRTLLERLSVLEGVVEKDLVTDFATYGLEQPLRQYILRASLTNALATVTNRIIDQLDIGARDPDKVYARRASESSVYGLARADYDQLPFAPWQFRHRQVWSFSTNAVKNLTITHHGQSRRLARTRNSNWSLAAGSTGVIKPEAINRLVQELSHLRAEIWVERDAQKRALYGFSDEGYKLAIELEPTESPNLFTLEFGGFAKSEFPYALATQGDQSWIFEFPLQLYFELRRDLAVSSSL